MISEIWGSLENEALKDGSMGIIKRRISPESQLDFFIGFDNHEKQRMFLLKVHRLYIRKIDSYPKSKGMNIRIVKLPDDDNEHATIELVLTNPLFKEVFTPLVEDIIEHIKGEKYENILIQKFMGRIIIWQQFLDQYTPEGLGEEAQRGLYGELWFLRKYLIPALGIKRAIDAWCGPDKSPQDFRFNGNAVEVKTTVSKQQEKLIIANEQQLDDIGLNALFLQHVSLITIDGHETLPDIISDLRKITNGMPESAIRFNDLLISSGYLDAHAERYSIKGYLVRDYHTYMVKEEFPRIIGNDLRNGIGDVHYSINVSECKHYEIDEKGFMGFLKGVC